MPYPFKNPVSPTYQDVMSSNIGIPSSEMIDYDNTDKAINANKRIIDLDNQIEELKQLIAERKAMNTKNGVEMYDYVVGGDRSGLDAIKQRALTEDMANKQREMTLELSKKQKESEKEYRLDEAIRSRNNALTNLQYAEEMLKSAQAKGDKDAETKASRDVQIAKEDFAYWNKRIGLNDKQEQTNVNVNNEPEQTNNDVEKLDVFTTRLKNISGGKEVSEYDKILEEIKSHPMWGQDKGLQEQFDRITKLKNAKIQWDKDTNFMNNWNGEPFDQNKFEIKVNAETRQPYLVRKNKGK